MGRGIVPTPIHLFESCADEISNDFINTLRNIPNVRHVNIEQFNMSWQHLNIVIHELSKLQLKTLQMQIEKIDFKYGRKSKDMFVMKPDTVMELSRLINIPSLHNLVFEIECESNFQELLTCFIARHRNRFENLYIRYVGGNREKLIGLYVNTIGCFDELPLINVIEKFFPRKNKIIIRSKSQRVLDDIARYREQNSISESKLPI